MRSTVVVVVEVRREDPLQVAIVENDHVVEAFSANRSNHAFAVRILPGRSGCRGNFINAHLLHTVSEIDSVAAVTITDEILRRLIPGKRFRDLLCRPARRGIRRDVEVNHPPALMAKDDETVQNAKGGGGHGKEVDADQITEVIVQKRAPDRRLSGSSRLRSR